MTTRPAKVGLIDKIGMKIRKGDEIKIVVGKDKGKSGKVTRVLPAEHKVLVEGLNLFKKHVRPRQADKKGEVILVPKSLHVSAVRLLCPNCHRPTRAGYQLEGRSKSRICKKCRKVL